MPGSITLSPRTSLPSAIYGDGEPVLAGVAVRDDVDRSELPRFGDDLWDLGAAIFRVNARYSNYRLNFAGIADPVTRRLAKEYVRPAARPRRSGCCATSSISPRSSARGLAPSISAGSIRRCSTPTWCMPATAGGGRRTRR